MSRFPATEIADACQLILQNYTSVLGGPELYPRWCEIGAALLAADRSASNELGTVSKREARLLVDCTATLPQRNKILLERLLSHLTGKIESGRGEAASVERIVRAMRGVLLKNP